MNGWILVVGGAALAAWATAAEVGAGAVSRLELVRWVSQRIGGAGAAGALLNAPGLVRGSAGTVATLGWVIAAFGLVATLADGWAAPAAGLALLVAVPGLIVLTLVVPRALGRRWPQQVVRLTVPGMHRLGRLLAPAMPSRYSALEGQPARWLRVSQGAELFDQDELAVLSGLLAFTERPAREIMTARTEVVAVAEDASPAEAARMVAESGYSRLPVYRGSLDQIVGMVYALDLLAGSPEGRLPVRPVVVAPASKRCADLLFELQQERRQLAVLLDEFGGTAGIVTLDDLLAALVAAVFGEPGASEPAAAEEPLLVEVDGAAPAQEVAARFGVQLPGAAETIGGLLARLAGRIPRAGERFLLQGLEFDVLAVGPTRVERVVVRRCPVPVTALPRGEPS